jgi:peptidyl-prolyl cis-trans isomerase C
MTKLSARGALLALAFGIAAVPALAADKDPVAAVVNGTEIHKSAIDEFRRTLPPNLAGAPYEALVDIVVNNQILSDQAKKDGTANDPEVKRALQQAQDKVLRQAWMSKKLKSEVTDEAVKAKYDEFVKNFKPVEEVRARHVLVDNEDQAKAIIAELNKGAKFEDVAKAKSKDPSAKQNGGDLGYFSKEEMVPEFSEAAFAMKPGQLSAKPVKTQFGWHVIKVEDKRQSQPPSFDEAKPMIREQLAEQTAEKVVTAARAKADVKRFDEDGKPLPEKK